MAAAKPKAKAKPKPAPELVSERGKSTASKPVERVRAVGEIRKEIVAFWLWGIAHEGKIGYAQERPMERLKTPAQLEKLPREADCSEFFTDGYAAALTVDPNGEHFNGTGFTGTLISNGHQIPLGEAQPGDAVIFGPGNGEHVCGILEPGDDPLLASHGSNAGPIAIRLSVERAYHDGPVRFFRYLPHA